MRRSAVMPETIPRIFHFVFGLKKQTEPFHLAYYLCLQSCLEVNKPERVYLYYKHLPYGRYWDLIKDRLTLVSVDEVSLVSEHAYRDKFIERHLTYAHHSDFIRVEKLHETGGVYCDIDTIFIRPIPNHLYEKPFVIGRESPVKCERSGVVKPSLCNAVMMSSPKSTFAAKYREQMPQSFDGTWSNHSCFLANELAEEHPELVHVEPQKSFYPYVWTKEDLFLLFESCEVPPIDSYSIHLWGHLWWSRRNREFSSFHSGQLSEKNIRNIDTTYNLIARKYLPPKEKVQFFFGLFENRRVGNTR